MLNTLRNAVLVRPAAALLAAVLLAAVLLSRPSSAQDDGRYYPLNHRQPAGTAGRWSLIAQPQLNGYPQPVRILTPVAAQVTFYDGSTPAGIEVEAPAQARMLIGHVYRVRISELDGFPGVELYPTIEVLDRLHPPSDQIDAFPIPIELTLEEIEAVLADQMVTKVVYLERQNLPRPGETGPGVTITDLSPSANLMEGAAVMGRPMAILRVGGRTPGPNAPADFAPAAAPLQITSLPRPRPRPRPGTP